MHFVAQNFRALQNVSLAIPTFGALTGPNGAGKSTFISLLRFARLVLDRDPTEAWNVVFRGSQNVVSRGVVDGKVHLAICDPETRATWWLSIAPNGPNLRIGDTIRSGSEQLMTTTNGQSSYRGAPIHMDGRRSALRTVVESEHRDATAAALETLVRGISTYALPDLEALRQRGSRISDPPELYYRSENLFSVLYRWHSRRPDKARYQFVLDGLRAAFPNICQDLDFETLADNVLVRVYAPGSDKPTWASEEAEGFLQMMALLTQVAGGADGGLVAIDEPETSLHPFALRELMRRARSWGSAHDLTILFATHSPVVLNEFNSDPASVIVFGADPKGPVPLTELKDPAWLANFTLGELYENLSLGSNAEPPTP